MGGTLRICAHVGHRSDHVGGREGPRASFRLLQPDDPRTLARRRSHPADVGPRRRRDPPPRSTGRERAAADRAARVRRRPHARSQRARPPRRVPGSGPTARCSTSAARSPSNRSTARVRSGSSRSSKGSTAGGPACCRRSITRSPTASAACASRSRSSTSNPTRRQETPPSGPIDESDRARHAVASHAQRGARRGDAQRRDGPPRDRRRHARAHASGRDPPPGDRHRPARALAAAPTLHRAGPLRRDAGRSLTRHFETYSISLPAVQAAARKLGGSVNDVYVTGLAGALGRYHERFGSSVDSLRLAMPISTRNRGDDAANRFVPAPRRADPARRRSARALRCRAQRLAATRARPRSARPKGSRSWSPACRPRSSWR